MELKDISKKRQKKWKETDLYKVKEDTDKPKYYILDMFPYPSGAALHVGHPKGFIATDALARKKMLQGFNVLHPMGFDTFGLGTEQYAIEHKMKPQDVAKQNIAKFIQQLESFGTTYDRSRSVNTADPKYFKWTQRVFLQLYNHYYDDEGKKAMPIASLKLKIENGELKINANIDEYLNTQRLAYVDYKPINRCPQCMTGLANEDLDDGKCERCGSEVEQKPMKQRVLRITKYAERLLEGLDDLNREESMKDLERNRIGKSEGTQFQMKIYPTPSPSPLHEEGILPKLDIGGHMIELARKLRKNATTAEQFLWEILRSKGIGYKFRRQHPIARYIADFYCAEAKLVIELDGGIHDTKEQKERDIYRDEVMKKYGFEIMRFKNKELFDDTETVLNKISSQLSLLCGAERGAEGGVRGGTGTLEFGVYTTRIDTVFGMSFVAIAPEHPLLKTMRDEKGEMINNWKEIEAYQEQANKKTQLERTELQKDKTGIEIKGIKAINPFNNEAIPIFVADYVLANYGTGVVMAVPAHDERDFEFAKKYNVPITEVIIKGPPPVPSSSKEKGGSTLPKNKKGFSLYQRIDKDITQFTKDLRKKQTSAEKVFRELVRNNTLGLKFRRQHPFGRYIVDFYCHELKLVIEIDGSIHDIEENKRRDKQREKDLKMEGLDIMRFTNDELFDNPQKILEKIIKYKNKISPLLGGEGEGVRSPASLDSAFTEKGTLVNSGEFSGLESDEAIKQMQKWLEEKGIGGVKVNYKMQDRVFSRQRYRGEPFPVLRTDMEIWKNGKMENEKKIVALDEKELPLLLPDVENYAPTGTEEGPLANISDWVNVTLPDGTKAKRETNTMPGRAGSSRYWLRYMDPNNDKALVGKDKEAYRGNVDVYVGGAEHITRHVIYGRFWQKFLFDIGVVSKEEPFQEYHSVGLIMGEDGRKMSKRRGNVVNPDDIINEFGTDVLRSYEMFMGPFDQSIAWSTNGIKGIKKFLEKIILLKDKIRDEGQGERGKENSTSYLLPSTLTIINQTIKKVGEDIDGFRFNTAISQLMILVNHLTDLKEITKKTFEDLIILVSPFAPHLAEELREQLGNEYSVFTKATWPTYDKKCLVADKVTIAVQINGKVRGTICIDKETEEKDAFEAAKADEKINTWITNEPKKIIYVKGKILNIVI